MKRTDGMVVAACAVACAASMAFFTRQDTAPPPAHAGAAQAPVAARVAPRPPPAAAWLPDPVAASRPRPALPPHIVARQQKMQALMTGSPPEYYTMTLAQLRELARHGDADAMMQLAEQYANEDGRLRADPDYPVAGNTRDLAKGYLADAMLAGRIRAAALLSKQLFDENQVGEAYAWRLVSEKLGDSVNPLWAGDTNQFAGLSDSEKAAAQGKATQLVDTLYQNKLREAMQRHPATR